jgi:hypothetical protein
MIELTDEQRDAVQNGEAIRVRENGHEFVLLRSDVYDRLLQEEYDDSPWTDEEMELLAWEAGKMAGWEEMDEYDEEQRRPCLMA